MARMLQCIRGLSEEKIAALIEHYPTPRSLFEAFREAEEKQLRQETTASSPIKPAGAKGKGKGKAKQADTPAAEMMLTDLGGVGRRKIGLPLSKHVYEVFMDNDYGS